MVCGKEIGTCSIRDCSCVHISQHKRKTAEHVHRVLSDPASEGSSNPYPYLATVDLSNGGPIFLAILCLLHAVASCPTIINVGVERLWRRVLRFLQCRSGGTEGRRRGPWCRSHRWLGQGRGGYHRRDRNGGDRHWSSWRGWHRRGGCQGRNRNGGDRNRCRILEWYARHMRSSTSYASAWARAHMHADIKNVYVPLEEPPPSPEEPLPPRESREPPLPSAGSREVLLLQAPPVAPVVHGHGRTSRVQQQPIPESGAVLVLGAHAARNAGDTDVRPSVRGKVVVGKGVQTGSRY
jgi:hypothetical protein